MNYGYIIKFLETSECFDLAESFCRVIRRADNKMLDSVDDILNGHNNLIDRVCCVVATFR